MANVTIKNGTTNVTFTFGDGDVKSVQVKKTANLDENPFPASDSDNNFIIDFNGVAKSIVIKGVITANTTTRTSSGTVKTIAEQLDWLSDTSNNLINGAQVGHTFNSTYQSDKLVYLRNFNYDEQSGNPNKVEFSFELVEGL